MKKRLTNTLRTVIVCIILLSLTACSPKPKTEEYVTRGEWITMLAEAFELDAYRENTPYYADVPDNHELFPHVQAAGEWSILSIYQDDTLDAGKPVTRGETASTAAFAAGFKPGEDSFDAGGQFVAGPSIDYAIAHGLAKAEGLSDFMTEDECAAVIELSKDFYLSGDGEEKVSVVYNENLIDLTEVTPSSIEVTENSVTFLREIPGTVGQDGTGTLTASIRTGDEIIQIHVGDVFIIPPTGDQQTEAAYKAASIEETGRGIAFTTETPDLGDLFDELVLHTTLSLDESCITWADGVVVSSTAPNQLSQDSRFGEYHIELLSSRPEAGPVRADYLSGQVLKDTSYKIEQSISLGDGAFNRLNRDMSSVLEFSSALEALDFSGFTYDDTPSISDFIASTETWEKKLTLEKKYSKDYKIEGTISLGLEVTPDIEYHKLGLFGIEVPWPESASLTVNSNIAAELKVEGNLEGELEIAKISIPTTIPGLTIDGSISLFADLNGAVQAKVEFQNMNRVEWQTSLNFRQLSEENTLTSSAQALADLSFGPSVSLSVCAFSIDIIGSELKVSGDVSATGTVEGTCREYVEDGITMREYAEAIHLQSDLYLPIISLTASGPECLADAFGFEETWDIIGKDEAYRFSIFDKKMPIWSQTVTLGPDGEIIGPADISSHTYTTRFGEVNFVTYPAFSFDYPENWTVTSEEVTPSSERVVLTSNTGATVTYWNLHDRRVLSDMTSKANRLYVKPVAEASFVPGFVQATDHSNLGEFMVAELTVTGTYDPAVDDDFVFATDGRTRYALLPGRRESQITEYVTEGLPTVTFWYSAHISLIASTPDGTFTEQEKAEVISILSSFQVRSVLHDPPNGLPGAVETSTAETIEELWTMLEGTWALEEYRYNGRATHCADGDHTVKFQYVDNNPCMVTTSLEEERHFRDKIFYDLEAMDEYHYAVYTYKRGSYGGEGANWGSDVQSVWWLFDLSDLVNGKLSMTYSIAMDSGFVDNYNAYTYVRQ